MPPRFLEPLTENSAPSSQSASPWRTETQRRAKPREQKAKLFPRLHPASKNLQSPYHAMRQLRESPPAQTSPLHPRQSCSLGNSRHTLPVSPRTESAHSSGVRRNKPYS